MLVCFPIVSWNHGGFILSFLLGIFISLYHGTSHDPVSCFANSFCGSPKSSFTWDEFFYGLGYFSQISLYVPFKAECMVSRSFAPRFFFVIVISIWPFCVLWLRHGDISVDDSPAQCSLYIPYASITRGELRSVWGVFFSWKTFMPKAVGNNNLLLTFKTVYCISTIVDTIDTSYRPAAINFLLWARFSSQFRKSGVCLNEKSALKCDSWSPLLQLFTFMSSYGHVDMSLWKYAIIKKQGKQYFNPSSEPRTTECRWNFSKL